MPNAFRMNKSNQVAREAIGAMTRHKIPPTPENFAVWYTHLASENPALSQMIQVLETNSGGIDATRSRKLHTRYFTPPDTSPVGPVATRLSKTLNDVSSLTDSMAKGTASYDRSLSGFAKTIGVGEPEAEIPAENLDGALEQIRNDTQLMQVTLDAMQEAMRAQNRELAALRSDLEAARTAAYTDALTGVGNRKACDDQIAQQMRDAEKNGHPLSVIYADIDHFKEVNDRHGHNVGDEVIKAVAKQLEASVSKAGFVARVGGEEFVIIVPRIDAKRAEALAEKLRSLVHTATVTKPDGRLLDPVTASFGVSSYVAGEAAEAVIERADAALYDAKRGGRNQVCVRQAPTPTANSNTDPRERRSAAS